MFELVKKWYGHHIHDPKGVLAPSLAMLTLPFLLPVLIDAAKAIEVQEVPYLLPSAITLATFILGQEFTRKEIDKGRAIEQEKEKKRRETNQKALFTRVVNELSQNKSTLSKNELRMTIIDEETGDTSPSQAPLNRYQNRYLIRALDEQTEILLTDESFRIANALSDYVDATNQLIEERKEKIEAHQEEVNIRASVAEQNRKFLFLDNGYFKEELEEFSKEIKVQHGRIRFVSGSLEAFLSSHLQ